MRLSLFPLIYTLLFAQADCAMAQGNTTRQEVADVAFRSLDKKVSYVLNQVVHVNQTHSAIYVGNTGPEVALRAVNADYGNPGNGLAEIKSVGALKGGRGRG